MISAEDNRSVVAAKSEGVAEGNIHSSFLGVVDRQVETGVNPLIIRKVVDGRRHALVHDRQDARDSFNCPGRP